MYGRGTLHDLLGSDLDLRLLNNNPRRRDDLPRPDHTDAGRILILLRIFRVRRFLLFDILPEGGSVVVAVVVVLLRFHLRTEATTYYGTLRWCIVSVS